VCLIEQILKAGVLEANSFQETPQGSPQGGILSPLLANIYLHELDTWWWTRYGGLSRWEKTKRRQEHKGNCVLTRYADDFVRHEARIEHGAQAPPVGRRAGSLSP
jgi:RNA-directed DNA polymerase